MQKQAHLVGTDRHSPHISYGTPASQHDNHFLCGVMILLYSCTANTMDIVVVRATCLIRISRAQWSTPLLLYRRPRRTATRHPPSRVAVTIPAAITVQYSLIHSTDDHRSNAEHWAGIYSKVAAITEE